MAHEEPTGAPASRSLARNSTVDAVVGACLGAIGIVVIVEARRLGAQWTSDGPGAGYFPFYIGLILAVCGAAILVQSLLARRSDGSVFVDREQIGRVAAVLGPSVLYAVGVMLLGIYVASAIFIAGFMIVLGKYAALRSVVVGVAVNAAFFVMFEVWFKVPLYKGTLEPLGFLGY